MEMLVSVGASTMTSSAVLVSHVSSMAYNGIANHYSEEVLCFVTIHS